MYLGEKKYNNQRKPPQRDGKHLKFVRTLPSAISGAYGCIAHHLLDVDHRGVAKKADDMWVIPLTPDEHNILHHVDGVTSATETEWLAAKGVSSHAVALFLWHNTGDYERCENFILGRTT